MRLTRREMAPLRAIPQLEAQVVAFGTERDDFVDACWDNHPRLMQWLARRLRLSPEDVRRLARGAWSTLCAGDHRRAAAWLGRTAREEVCGRKWTRLIDEERARLILFAPPGPVARWSFRDWGPPSGVEHPKKALAKACQTGRLGTAFWITRQFPDAQLSDAETLAQTVDACVRGEHAMILWLLNGRALNAQLRACGSNIGEYCLSVLRMRTAVDRCSPAIVSWLVRHFAPRIEKALQGARMSMGLLPPAVMRTMMAQPSTAAALRAHCARFWEAICMSAAMSPRGDEFRRMLESLFQGAAESSAARTVRGIGLLVAACRTGHIRDVWSILREFKLSREDLVRMGGAPLRAACATSHCDISRALADRYKLVFLPEWGCRTADVHGYIPVRADGWRSMAKPLCRTLGVWTFDPH